MLNVDETRLAEVLRILEIGLHHEQQHQELLLTDILHAFAQNPVAPAYDADWRAAVAAAASARICRRCRADCTPSASTGEGYSFDNEGPAHQVFLQPARIARGLVTNAQWLDFMADGGYATPVAVALRRLGDVEAEGWNAPGYWRKRDGAWFSLTLGGPQAGRSVARRSCM